MKGLNLQKKKFRYLGLWIREFLHPRNLSGFLTPEGIKLFGDPLTSPARLYLAVSHALLDFELIRLPSPLPPKKLFTAARLEAIRLYRLFHRGQDTFLLSLWPKSDKEIIAFLLKEGFLTKNLANIPDNLLISGVFPSFVSLWAYLLSQRKDLSDGLYFVHTPWSYEGFYTRAGKPVGILPSAPGAAQLFIKHFDGSVIEIPGDPLQIIAKGTLLVPYIFQREIIPCFEGYPLKVRPKINTYVLYFWLLPLICFISLYPLNAKKEKIFIELKQKKKELSILREKFEELENKKRAIEEEKKLAQKLKPYLPENRPPLLDVLLEITKILPKDTWIRRFDFNAPDEIRIWGEGKNSLKILENLSASPLFKDVRFISTVTKNPRTEKESFSIVLKLNLPLNKD